MQLDLTHPRPISLAAIREGCQTRQLQQLQEAASRPVASKLQHYILGMQSSQLEAASVWKLAAYLTGVRERCRWEALAQWVTGSHWGAEESGRWHHLPLEQRLCPHCCGGTETVAHMFFTAPCTCLLLDTV